ncbi:uncharacterized protein LOC116113012 [Pistacia vera]|uniref:uncharacterized protein LOC116113012 n=1 Tax=Pistacia vera TaxID=55513 RepID=UPI001263A09A|nr:uncharacterized protein LOC116113012 [Pistacia vera]
MRNSFISDLLRFANPTQNFPSRLNELSSFPGFNLYGTSMTDSSSVDIPNFPNLMPQTYLGALQSTNVSDISFVGTEIDEYLTRASQMSLKDAPNNVDGAAMFNDSDDELVILDNMEPIPGNDTATFTNEEALSEAQQPAKVKRRRLNSSASGQATEDNVTPEETNPSFSDKLRWLKNLIPDNSSKGLDTVSVLEDAAKYVRSLQRKREFLKQRVDPQTFMDSEELRLKAQYGKIQAFKPVYPKCKSKYPFIFPAPPHQISRSGQPERQGFFSQFTQGTSMRLPPLPDQMPLPEPVPDLHEQVQTLPPWDDELQKLVNQCLR